MKIAVIGSRGLEIKNIEKYLPKETTEIVSGGAKGIDKCAEEYARSKGLAIKIFLPNYERYGKGAPLKRNIEIIEYADAVIALWDGRSRGTKYVIDQCKKINKPINIYIIEDNIE